MKLTDTEYYTARDRDFYERIEKTDSCWEFIGTKTHGYGSFSAKRSGTKLAHQYSFIRHHGPIPEGHWVLHTCNNRSCCNPDHLYAGTPNQNAYDRLNRKRSPHQKLTPDVVVSMRREFDDGATLVDLTCKYKVATSCIYAAVKRITWKHI
jgi:hypothetical protein